MLGPTPSRREFLAAAGVALLGAACSKAVRPSPTPSGPPGSIDDVTSGANELSIIGTGSDALPMNPGKNRLGFLLIRGGGQVLEGGAPRVWVAKDTKRKAIGPFAATWNPFTAYATTGDEGPKSAFPGVYSVEIDYPAAGPWSIGITAQLGSKRSAGQGAVLITDGPVVAGLGTKALPTPTPVATTVAKIQEICTRNPVDRMHYISLKDALKNGKPTVVSFATPLLCESRLCGPVVDEQIVAFQSVGKDRANFIHVEEFLPGPAHQPPPPEPQNVSPSFKAWGFDSEPWVVIIDRGGIIRFRSLGPVTAPEIEAALRPLL